MYLNISAEQKEECFSSDLNQYMESIIMDLEKLQKLQFEKARDNKALIKPW